GARRPDRDRERGGVREHRSGRAAARGPAAGAGAGADHRGRAVTAASTQTRPLVLVAEDDEDILELVAATLESEGFDIARAANGRQALERISAEPPDLAVLDVRMPGIDGLKLSHRIRQSPETRDVPVILLSALVDGSDVERGFEAGATDYVKKPFSPHDLIARISAIL